MCWLDHYWVSTCISLHGIRTLIFLIVFIGFDLSKSIKKHDKDLQHLEFFSRPSNIYFRFLYHLFHWLRFILYFFFYTADQIKYDWPYIKTIQCTPAYMCITILFCDINSISCLLYRFLMVWKYEYMYTKQDVVIPTNQVLLYIP